MEQDQVIMSKIGIKKDKSKSKSSKNVFNHLQKDNADFYFEDDDKSEQPVKYDNFQRK